ncbi:MAG TPA: phosphoribosylglycinamide formyltransferase [Polyangia bacterium]|nr:phosphoribosylglycinamide formyltransferase [Polyangia bacterium]
MTGIGVLVSGSGSNLQAILDAQARGELGGEVRVVISNVAGVRALERARAANVPTRVLPHREFASREAFDDALVAALVEARVEIVALAGFMRIVTRRVLDAFPGRVVNIHPSLLPAFPGLHAQRQALDYGARVAGCTVHFVDEGCDSGPIIAQAAVPVLDGDTEDALAARILGEEHRVYPAALRALAEGRVTVAGRRVILRPA